MLRLTAALRPEGINWPINEKNQISFRLEKLTEANGIFHQDAHDALSDVHATIAIAKLVKTHQPRLYDYYLQLRNKHKVLELLNIYNPRPLLHISGMYPAQYGHCALILPLMVHPENKNGIIVYDLRYDPKELLALSADEIRQRIYTPKVELEEQGLERIPLKTIHINKCPAIAPINTLTKEASQRLEIDIQQQQINIQGLLHNKDLIDKLSLVFSSDYQNNPIKHDVDQALYSGGFAGPADKEKMEIITQSNDSGIKQLGEQFGKHFKDHRFEKLFFRYMGRNFNHLLSQQDKSLWEQYRIKRMTDNNDNASITYSDYINTVDELIAKESNESKLKVLNELKKYPQQIGLD